MVDGPGFNYGREFGCPTCRVYTWGIGFDPLSWRTGSILTSPASPSLVKENLHIDDFFTLAKDRWFLSVPLNSFAGLLRPLR